MAQNPGGGSGLNISAEDEAILNQLRSIVDQEESDILDSLNRISTRTIQVWRVATVYAHNRLQRLQENNYNLQLQISQITKASNDPKTQEQLSSAYELERNNSTRARHIGNRSWVQKASIAEFRQEIYRAVMQRRAVALTNRRLNGWMDNLREVQRIREQKLARVSDSTRSSKPQQSQPSRQEKQGETEAGGRGGTGTPSKNQGKGDTGTPSKNPGNDIGTPSKNQGKGDTSTPPKNQGRGDTNTPSRGHGNPKPRGRGGEKRRGK